MRQGKSKIFERDPFASARSLGTLASLFLCSQLWTGCEATTCAEGFTREDGRCRPATNQFDASSDSPDAAGESDANDPSTPPKDAGSDAALPIDAGRPADAGSDAHTPCGLIPFFEDRDGDGHGSPRRRVDSCTPPRGYVTVGDDCDDACAECKPGGSGMCIAASADFSCITRCGSTGTGTCTSGCELSCAAPEEVCNYADDDCDGSSDEALRKLSLSPLRAQASVRTWVFAQGEYPLAFVQLPATAENEPSELRVRRLLADGSPASTDTSVMNVALRSSEYALAATGENVVVVWAEADSDDSARKALRGRILRRSDLTDVVAPRTLAIVDEVLHPVVSASTAGVLVVFSQSDHVARVSASTSLENPSAVQRFEGSRQGRSHALLLAKSRTWLVAYPSTSSPGSTDLYLQVVAAGGELSGPGVNATQARMNEETSPWLAEDGLGNVALTFHDQGSGGLHLLLFRLSDLQSSQLLPTADVSVSTRAGTCISNACRSSSVAWTSGYWTVLYALEDDSRGHTIQARMYGARGAPTADGSQALTLATDAGEIFAPYASALKSGVTVFATSAGESTRYARWGCF